MKWLVFFCQRLRLEQIRPTITDFRAQRQRGSAFKSKSSLRINVCVLARLHSRDRKSCASHTARGKTNCGATKICRHNCYAPSRYLTREPPISKRRAHFRTRLRRVRDGHETRNFIRPNHRRGGEPHCRCRAAMRSKQEPRQSADTIFPAPCVHLRGRAWHIAVRTKDAAIPFDRLHDPAAPLALIKVLDCVFVHGLTFVMSARRTNYCGYKLIHRSTRPDALNEPQ